MRSNGVHEKETYAAPFVLYEQLPFFDKIAPLYFARFDLS